MPAAELAARQAAGLQLARNSRLVLSAVSRGQLAAGEVDPRLLILLAALAAEAGPVQVIAFGAGISLRAVTLAGAVRAMLAFALAQRPPPAGPRGHHGGAGGSARAGRPVPRSQPVRAAGAIALTSEGRRPP